MIKTLLRNKLLLLVLLNTTVIVAICCFVFIKDSHEQIVYINSQKVFEGFNMTIEVNKAGVKEVKQRSKAVDSLYNLLQTTDSSSKELLVKQFAEQKEELENFTNNFYNEQSLKIWTRIKDYSIKFSEENKYEILLGSKQDENVIYGSTKRDVSYEFIKYINEKYEGSR